MQTLWFILVGFMLTMYVVLDGFDLGAGAIHLFAAKNDEERRMILEAIGPVWDGNEVWLIAAGGTLFFSFPVLYASSFSGFYLPLIIVLWLLILRGISIELRSHIQNEVWTSFWDGVFFIGSTLLAIFYCPATGKLQFRCSPLGSYFPTNRSRRAWRRRLLQLQTTRHSRFLCLVCLHSGYAQQRGR